MRRYIVTGTLLLLASMACEEKKPSLRRVETHSSRVVTSPLVAKSAAQEATPLASPTIQLAAKTAPRVQYEDVAGRVLDEGSQDESKEQDLDKIREKALLRLKELQAEEQTAQGMAPDSSKLAGAEPTSSAGKVALAEPEKSVSEVAPILEDMEPVPIKKLNPALNPKTFKKFTQNLRIAKALAKAGKPHEAKELYLKSCVAGHVAACHKYAWQEELSGKIERARRYYLTACDHGLGKSCNNLAFQFEQKEDWEKARALYTRGCQNKHKASCASLQRILQQNGSSQPEAKASKIH